ncbi:MAG: S8 family serine peptidase [archaeon]
MGCKFCFIVLLIVLFPIIYADSEKVDVIVKLKDSSVMKARINAKLDSYERLNTKKEEISKIRKLVMNRYEKEFSVKRQFNFTNALSISISKSALARLKKDPNIEFIVEDLPLHTYLNDASPIIGAPTLWNLDIYPVNGTGETACVIDTGIDLSHSAFGSCNIISNTYFGNELNYSAESSHPYSTNQNLVYRINQSGFFFISVHFLNISLEPEWDYLKVLDANNNTIAVYTGHHNNTWSPSVVGDTLYLKFESDESITDWGFAVDRILNGSSDTVMNYSSCEKIPAGWDLSGSITTLDDDNPMDDHGHGTHVSGIIGSIDPTYRGVSPGARIVPVKAMDSSGDGNTTDVMAAIEFCIENKERFNISVITLSLGGGTYSGYCDSTPGIYTLFSELVNEAVNQGIMVVAASGNVGSSTGIAFPACLENVTSVGATTKADAVDVSYSNSGNNLDLLAPGSDITSALLGGGFISDSGTSMSAPFVSGAAILLRNFKKLENGSILSPRQIEEALRHGDNITDPRNSQVYPRINITKALTYIDDMPRISFISGNTSCNCSDSFVSITTSERVLALIEFDGINLSMNGSMNSFYYNISIANNSHNYSIHVEDSTGNIISSELFIMSYPRPSPSMNLTLNLVNQNLTIEKNSSVEIGITSHGDIIPIRLYIDSQLVYENYSINYSYQVPGVGRVNISAVYPGSQNYSETSLSLYIDSVDTTPPGFDLISPLNGSQINSSYNILFSVLTSENATCILNSTMDFSGIIEHTIAYSHYANDEIKLLINCTDFYNNSNLKLYNFTVNDLTSPLRSSTVTSTTSAVAFAETFDEPGNLTTILNSVTQNSDYGLSHSLTFSSLDSGTAFAYSIIYCDRLGNCAQSQGTKSTETVTVAKSGSGGGGGGHSISVASVAVDEHTQIIANPSEGTHIVDFTLDDINSVIFVLQKQEGSVAISVRKTENVMHPLDSVFEYYEINKTDSDIEDIRIRFSVPATWLEGKNPDNIVMQRYSGVWEKLNTRRIGQNSDLYQYEADSPGMSLFAITYEDSAILEIEEKKGIDILDIAKQSQNTTLENPNTTSADKHAAYLLSFVLLSLGGISSFIFYYMNRKHRN